MNSIKVRQLFDYNTWTYTYLLWCEETRKCLLIDPVLEQVDRDLNYIKKLDLNLLYILETNVHADHITGAYSIKNQTDAKICYGSKTGVEGSDLYLEDNQEIVDAKDNNAPEICSDGTDDIIYGRHECAEGLLNQIKGGEEEEEHKARVKNMPEEILVKTSEIDD